MRTLKWNGHDVPVPPLDMNDTDLFHRQEFLRRAINFVSFNEIKGDYAEFGCASARTFRMAYDLIQGQKLATRLWAFDSFCGLPRSRDDRDMHPKWTEGNYPTPRSLFEGICAQHGIPRGSYEMIEGYYCDTIGPNAIGSEAYAPEIAIANIDCDMYSSTFDVLHFLKPRLKTGMILYFDDYYCYGDRVESGERKAMEDFLRENPQWRFVPFQTVDWHGQAFIAEHK